MRATGWESKQNGQRTAKGVQREATGKHGTSKGVQDTANRKAEGEREGQEKQEPKEKQRGNVREDRGDGQAQGPRASPEQRYPLHLIALHSSSP